MLRQFSFIGIFSVCHRFTVVTVSGLEAVSGGAYVGLCNVVVGCCNLGLVNNIRTQAIAIGCSIRVCCCVLRLRYTWGLLRQTYLC